MQLTPRSTKSRAVASPTATCTVVGSPTFFASSSAAAAWSFSIGPISLMPSAPRSLAARTSARYSVGRLIERLSRFQQVGEHRIEHDARRDDRVRRALGPPLLGLLEVAADLAGRRDAGRQVEVALVLDRDRADPLLVPVHVRVDDARHDVLAGGVDDGVGFGPASAGAVADPGDEAVLDQDVARVPRPARRSRE